MNGFGTRVAGIEPGVPLSTGWLWVVIACEVVFLLLYHLLPEQGYLVGGVLMVAYAVLVFMDLRVFLVAIPLLTFAFQAPWVQFDFVVRFLGMNWYAMDWVLFLALLAFAARRLNGQEFPAGRERIARPLKVFLAFLPLFVAVGLSHGIQTKDAFADARLFFYYVSFFGVIRIARTSSDLRLILWATVIGGIIGTIPVIVDSVTQYAIDPFTLRKLFFRRIAGAHEVNYPLLLVACVGMFPLLRRTWERVTVGSAMALSSVALLLSYTRGSWLAAVAGLVTVVVAFSLSGVSLKRYVKHVAVGAAVGIIGLILLSVSGVFTVDVLVSRASVQASRSIDISSLQRVTEWAVAFGEFLKHPILGTGL